MDTSHAPTAAFDVEADFALPDLEVRSPDAGRAEPTTTRQETTYVDTGDKDLHRLGLRLSRRSGDQRPGWALEAPRSDLSLESGARSRTVPPGLADVLFGVRRGHELQPVLTATRTLTTYRVAAGADAAAVELVDTRLDAATMGIESTIAGWRTLEIFGDESNAEVAAALAERLRTAGAVESSASHIDALLSLGAVTKRRPDSQLLGGLVQAYLDEQIEAITWGDLGLRHGQPVVHPTRVAIRRLRSTLRVFRGLIEVDQAATLDAELRWIAVLLGEVRDAEVLSARLQSQLVELPAEDVLGPVSSHLVTALATQRSAGLKRARQAMNEDRYLQLLETLHGWRRAAPMAAEASEPAVAAAAYLTGARRKLDARIETARVGDAVAVHRARKAAKRLRYAGELAEPAVGKKATKAVRRATKLQTMLGRYTDADVTAAFLRRLGAEAGSRAGHNGYTYGLLAAREQHRIQTIRRKLAEEV